MFSKNNVADWKIGDSLSKQIGESPLTTLVLQKSSRKIKSYTEHLEGSDILRRSSAFYCPNDDTTDPFDATSIKEGSDI